MLEMSELRSKFQKLLRELQDAVDSDSPYLVAKVLEKLAEEVRDQRDQHQCSRRAVFGLVYDSLKWTSPFVFPEGSVKSLRTILWEVTESEPPERGIFHFRRILQRGGLAVSPIEKQNHETIS